MVAKIILLLIIITGVLVGDFFIVGDPVIPAEIAVKQLKNDDQAAREMAAYDRLRGSLAVVSGGIIVLSFLGIFNKDLAKLLRNKKETSK